MHLSKIQFSKALTLERPVISKRHHWLMKCQIIPKVLNLLIPNLLTFHNLPITFLSLFVALPENIYYALPPPRAGDVI